jgi:hypothetical protein
MFTLVIKVIEMQTFQKIRKRFPESLVQMLIQSKNIQKMSSRPQEDDPSRITRILRSATEPPTRRYTKKSFLPGLYIAAAS